MPRIASVTFLTLIFVSGCGLLGDQEEFGVRRDLVRRLSEIRQRSRVCGSTEFDAAGPLLWDDRLAESALRHSRDLAATGRDGHTGSDGSSPRRRVRDTGYDAAIVGEVVAVGGESMDEVVSAWLNSSGHCRIIMNPNLTEAGGAVQALAWTVDMARPSR